MQKRYRFKKFMFFLLTLFPFAVNALQPLSEDDMSLVAGQGLFVADTIAPTGSSGSTTDFTFYRMGLDVELALNANIDKLQLGCGGFNELIAPNSCDIDMDFVRFMGRSGSGPGAAVTSDFLLTRPYIEIAVRNDGTASTREVAGIKVGAQEADGLFGVGRRYSNGQTNLENGGSCTGAAEGNGALACHSGLNRVSGYLFTEMSAQVPITISGIISENSCFGNTAQTNDACGAGDTFTTELVGTRLNTLELESIPLKLSGGLLSAIGLNSGYAQISQNLRFVHQFSLENTQDFFMSFQREQIRYPKYDKSGYAVTANAGWWMNVPSLKAVNIQGQRQTLGLFEALGSLSPPGVPLSDVELNQSPPDNCFGSNVFC